MATKTFEELKQLAIQIRDEKTNKQNTATRVGTAMLEHINKLEQDYYDKTQTDEELKERDDKLTELSKTFLFCDNYQELENPQLISEYEENKILAYDGSVIDYDYHGFKVYSIKNSESLNKPIFIKYDFLLAEFTTRTYLNVALYDENDNFLVGYAVSGTRVMEIPYGYTLKISADNNNPVIKGYRLSNSNISKTFLFCDSYQELENPQLISEYEENKILAYDGSVIDFPHGFKVYSIKNSESLNKPIFIKYDFLLAEFTTRTYLNVALYDENDKFIVGYAVSGTRIMEIPYGYTLKISADNNNPVIKGYGLLVGSITNDLEVIDCVGDSLSMAGVYESELQKLTGLSCVNLGVGGENTATILGRMNGIPYKIAEKVTIPSSKDTIQIKLTNIYNQRILPLLQGNKTIGITIRGVEGILSTTQTDATAENADYFFERNIEGEQFTVEKGENIYITSNKLYQNSNRAKIIWVGQNGGFSINETGRYQGDFSNQEDRARYIAMLKTYINVVNPIKYIVMSPPEFTTDEIENDLDVEFGGCFINVRKEMINNGIPIAKKIGLLDSNYPTEGDLEDIGNIKIPRSLRSDNIHFNDIGYKVLAHIIYNKICVIWNLDKLVE